MKICFLIHSMNPGGAERTVAYLSNYLVNSGHQVDLVHYGDRGYYELDDKVNVKFIGKQQKKFDLLSRAYIVLARILDFKKYAKNNKPDVIVCLLGKSLIYTFFVSRKIKKITSERSNPADMKSKLKIIARNFLYKYADGIIFQTKRAEQYFSRTIKGKGIVIPNAVGNECINTIPEIIQRKSKISAMGTLKREKDYPTLLKAFSKVIVKHPEYILEIYGNGVLENQLKELAKELNLGNKVIFAGSHPDALLRISDSECYVLSSIAEGMPNALMEAMAVGLPCVSTDCSNGPSELIENGYNGLLVPVGDYEAMADAICKYIEDKKFAEFCGKNAKNIRETNSIDTICNRYLDYFINVVKNNK